MNFLDVQAEMVIVTRMDFAICAFRSVNAIPGGLETLVMNMIVLDILHALIMVTVVNHSQENAIAIQGGLEKCVKSHAFTA